MCGQTAEIALQGPEGSGASIWGGGGEWRLARGTALSEKGSLVPENPVGHVLASPHHFPG